MNTARIIVGLSVALILGVPFLFRPAEMQAPADARRLIIITPHNEQIRYEFGLAFSEWHMREYGQPVVIDWRRIGGTSEILRQLISIYRAAAVSGRVGLDGACEPGIAPYDLMFGGGSYDHSRLKQGASVRMNVDGEERSATIPMSVPLPFSSEELAEWFGDGVVGASPLFERDRYWVGTALSTFGVSYNRDVLARLGVKEPARWEDLCDPALAGWLALADPRQSGSVTTTYDAILSNYGWDGGWRILRSMAANARSFAASSPKVVIDVSRGEAAIGLSIDFYGRFESQAVLLPGQRPEESRVGYVDPAGAVLVDPDPVSILRGGPEPEIALRFVRYLLTHEGQALWQLAVEGEDLGQEVRRPRQFELRRLPARPETHERFGAHFIDQVDPFAIASATPSRGWRGLIMPVFGAFSIDIHHDMRRAWLAMDEARRRGVDAERMAEMERLFFAMPMHELPDGRSVPFSEEYAREIRADWADPRREPELRIAYTIFFRDNYREIVRIAR